MLWVRVFNPSAPNASVNALAIVDTGADDCVFPAKFAAALNHNLKSVKAKPMGTVNGQTFAYPHICTIQVLNMLDNGRAGDKILYTLNDVLIDFAERCEPFLLGAKQFLSKFVLTIDYPNQVFSIRNPKSKYSPPPFPACQRPAGKKDNS